MSDISDKKELLIGSGYRRFRIMDEMGIRNLSTMKNDGEWNNLTTLDIDPNCKPDVIHDLNMFPYPFEDNTFDEIHAYDMMQHIGRQGDIHTFFKQFSELQRILKPNGYVFIGCPKINSIWVWSDPGHCRYIGPNTLQFLSQDYYERERVNKTPATDYRYIWKGDFKIIYIKEMGELEYVSLKSIK